MLHGNEACQACAYWQRLEGKYADQGLCRRHAPHCVQSPQILREGPESLRANWPITVGENWCGEFVATPPANTRLKET